MRRNLLFCCGLALGLVAGIILWNSPLWYINDDDPVPIALTQIAGVALSVQGAVVALAAALCLGRALVPLTRPPAGRGSARAAVGGGPVLPLCGLLFVVAGIGPLGESRRAAKDYELDQSRPAQARSQEWMVERDRRLIPVGQTFAVLWFAIGGALLVTPLFLKRRVWQLGRRLDRGGCTYAIGGLVLSVLGILAWFLNEAANALGGLGGGHSSHGLSFVGYLAIIAGAILAVIGSVIAVAGKSEARKVTA